MPADTPQLRKRVYDALRNQIGTGFYPAGEMLPSTRALAAEWGIPRSTVVSAYDQLIAEGYIESRAGARARVMSGLVQPVLHTAETSLRPAGPTLSAFGDRVAALTYQTVAGQGRLIADFRYGDVASADFPALAWSQAISAAALQKSSRLRYGDPRGLPELRAALQAYLWRARGLRCDLEQVVVVSGSQQGLDLCARLLLDPGDKVLVENPSYNLARHVFTAAGASLVALLVDDDGLKTDQLPAQRGWYDQWVHRIIWTSNPAGWA